jgi:hypothetical protein
MVLWACGTSSSETPGAGAGDRNEGGGDRENDVDGNGAEPVATLDDEAGPVSSGEHSASDPVADSCSPSDISSCTETLERMRLSQTGASPVLFHESGGRLGLLWQEQSQDCDLNDFDVAVPTSYAAPCDVYQARGTIEGDALVPSGWFRSPVQHALHERGGQLNLSLWQTGGTLGGACPALPSPGDADEWPNRGILASSSDACGKRVWLAQDDNLDIVAVRWEAGEFGEVETLDPAIANGSRGLMDVNDAGSGVALWEHDVDGRTVLRGALYDSVTGWQPSTQISGDDHAESFWGRTDYALDVNAAGQGIVTWLAADSEDRQTDPGFTLWARRFDASGWGELELLKRWEHGEVSPGHVGAPGTLRANVSEGGRSLVFWTESGDFDAEYPPDGVESRLGFWAMVTGADREWGAPEWSPTASDVALRTDALGSEFAMDESGNAALAYRLPGAEHLDLYALVYRGDSGWAEPTLLTPDSPGEVGYLYSVLLDGEGATIVWEQYEGARQRNADPPSPMPSPPTETPPRWIYAPQSLMLARMTFGGELERVTLRR